MHWTGAPTYGVQKRLGGGAFATVYLLATRRGGSLYAAKEIQKKNVNTQELDIKINTEINIMKRVTHVSFLI
jgi:serine/threonine protein kinase